MDVDRNRRISAGEKYLRAAIYFMTAERMGKSNSPERLVTYKKMLHCLELGTQNLQAPVTKVQVPFRDTFLPALFYQAQNTTDNSPDNFSDNSRDNSRAPCIIHFDGLDVMKEYLYLTGLSAEYARRGISTLLLDHPGVGEALRLQDLKLTPNTEEPASAAIDYLESRADIDPNKIGIAGISLGGYYAPRAAGFESRISCVVAWGSINDYGAITRGRLDGSGTNLSVSHWEEHMHWVLGTSTRDEIISFTDEMVLDEALANIRCPLLILHGENDRQIPVAMAKKTAAGTVNSPSVELKIFTEEEGGVEHCQVDHSSLAIEYMTDWGADVFND
ncbi:MAG: prolyl oligopeptidase family serine peptidase [Rhodospirillaceae bacterium]|nr:prolyl oligopeptidase family serine peptidase [Rhodospirillaceae bacterium]